MMGGLSIWHWLVLAIVVAWAVAVAKILKRLGFNPVWAIFSIFPPVSLLGIWMIALADWPLEDRALGAGNTFK